jgi:hypothetical protein
MRWAGYLAHTEEVINAYKILVGKPGEQRPLGIRRHQWKDNIKMGLWEIVFGGVDLIHLAWDRDQWWALVNRVMNLLAP